ncbi:PIH1 domain-containing protein 1 isoform X4 [Scaptodrosophila lebanonensis]|uniref:PIH1 domain-containing protein 1 n=1 Tax=Drosophila lebanonensis TaxID=7225 RepID=A0A6J2U839_DROLE|nr:PIH1 domain-containing protein 1 isoform X4 [Scaptodrosophila lebanonensis]
MSKHSNFLDGNDRFKEQNLRFVRNDLQDNINQFFGRSGTSANIPPRDSMLVQPKPGFCIKSFKLNTNEKFFINVCQASEVPAPKDVTEEELIAILESSEASSFRVPMSMSVPRNTNDRSNNTVEVCDIAINPQFLLKIKKSQLFSNFFLQIVAEALSEKYNIQISMDKTIILNNRKFIGTLVSHRVRNDDINTAKVIGEKTVKQLHGEQEIMLVQEINENELQALTKKSTNETNKIKINQRNAGSNEVEYKIRARVKGDVVDEIHAELYLPNCISSQELSLDIGEDRVLVESSKHGYIFDKFFSYRLHQERAQALFDKTSKMLQIRIPVMA